MIPARFLERPRHCPQHSVAYRMAMGIIDRLEMVYVAQSQAHGMILPGERPIFRFERPAVRELCQQIASCLFPCALELRSEEHTSELQSLMRISYAVFCLKKNKDNKSQN